MLFAAVGVAAGPMARRTENLFVARVTNAATEATWLGNVLTHRRRAMVGTVLQAGGAAVRMGPVAAAAAGSEAAGAPQGSTVLNDWLPLPPRNRKRGQELAGLLSKESALPVLSWLERIERAVTVAAVTPATWARHRMILDELNMVAARWPMMSDAEVMVRWGAVSLTMRVPTSARTLWDTAMGLVPGVKADPRVKCFATGMGVLWGRMPWYPRGPSLTRATAAQLIFGAPEVWLAARMDILWHSFGRDADVQHLLVADLRWTTWWEMEIDFTFLKNDLTAEHGTKKLIRPMRPGLLHRFLDSRPLTEPVFTQGYRQVLEGMRRVLGPAYGTRSIRRGAATVATQAGATRQTVQTLLAHRTETQQRTYTRLLTSDDVIAMREAQIALRGPLTRPMRVVTPTSACLTSGATMVNSADTMSSPAQGSVAGLTPAAQAPPAPMPEAPALPLRPLPRGAALVAMMQPSATPVRSASARRPDFDAALRAAYPTTNSEEDDA